MGQSLDRQLTQAQTKADIAALGRQAATDKAYQLHINKNLRNTRKRPRGYTTPGPAKRDMSERDRLTAMAKARQKVAESPIVSGMIQTLAANAVGMGFKLAMTSGDDDYNREVEQRWKLAKDKLDIRGMRSWGQLLRLWFFRRFIDGDVGVWKIPGKLPEEGEPARSFLQTIESHRIKDVENPQDSGVLFDRFGRPKTFLLMPTADRKDAQRRPLPPKSRRIKATDMIFYANFPGERAEEERGTSNLLQNLNAFTDLEQIIESMMDKVKKEALMGIKFGMESAENGSIFGSDLEETKAGEDGKQRKHVNVVQGMNFHLRPGETVEPFESKSPNGSYDPFIKLMLRMNGTNLGLPLEVLLYDWSGTSYSGGRMITESAKKQWRIDQRDLGIPASKAFEFWIAREIKHNGLTPPPKVLTKRLAWAHRWVTPGWPYIDPVKEVTAQGQALALGLTSHQNELDETGNGEDFEDLMIQREKESRIAATHGQTLFGGMPGQPILGTPPETEEDDEQ